jgi:hypothetical protein
MHHVFAEVDIFGKIGIKVDPIKIDAQFCEAHIIFQPINYQVISNIKPHTDKKSNISRLPPLSHDINFSTT